MIKEAKALATAHTTHELSSCLSDLTTSSRGVSSFCATFENMEPLDMVNIVAKALFIRNHVDDGMPINQAVRELAARMRFVQEVDDES